MALDLRCVVNSGNEKWCQVRLFEKSYLTPLSTATSVQRSELLLHLLQRLGLDLADALGGDAELGGKLVQRLRIGLGEPARPDDAPPAFVGALQRLGEPPAPVALGLLPLEKGRRPLRPTGPGGARRHREGL